MTLMQANFVYDGHIGEHGAHLFAEIRNIYGWAFHFDEMNRKITVDCYASRLQESDIAFMLRNAGVPLTDISVMHHLNRHFSAGN